MANYNMVPKFAQTAFSELDSFRREMQAASEEFMLSVTFDGDAVQCIITRDAEFSCAYEDMEKTLGTQAAIRCEADIEAAVETLRSFVRDWDYIYAEAASDCYWG